MSDLDLLERNATEPIRVVGSEADGTERDPIGSSEYRELFTYDVANNGGEDTTLIFDPAEVIELKVGASVKTSRKYIQIQALSRDIKWGFSPTTQNFDAFKNQFFILPFGPNTSIYLKYVGVAGTGMASIAEVS